MHTNYDWLALKLAMYQFATGNFFPAAIHIFVIVIIHFI
jgi:hypothetical protein